MGRWKGSPQGPYWDPNDTGPNQVDPPPGASPNGPQAPMGAPDANAGGIAGQMPGGLANSGINGGPAYQDWRTSPEGQQYTDIIKSGGNPNTPQLGMGGKQAPPPGYHYGMDWTANQLFPDDPNNPNTPPTQKHGPGWMGMDANGGGTIGSLGQPETGPPPGMSQESWQQGQDYLNSMTKPHTSIFGQQVPGVPSGGWGQGQQEPLIGPMGQPWTGVKQGVPSDKSGGKTGTISSLMNGGNLAGTGSAFGALFGKR